MSKIIPSGLTRTVATSVLKAKKNSPHIFFAGGIIGVVSSTILACRATLKLEATLDEIKTDVEHIKEQRTISPASTDVRSLEEIQKDDYKDLVYVGVKSSIKIGKLYGPSIALGAASIAALTGSHVQMTRRNAALTATLSLVSKAYDDYRVRVQEEIGTDKELDIYRATKNETVEIDGKKKAVRVTDPNGLSPYARIFDECSVNWQKDNELNRIFLQCQQNYANHKLRTRGYVFLNEVYEALGFEWSQAGQVVGWVINGDGDNYIDFGMFDAYNSRFVNGIERSIILDFNVDGVVQNKI